LISLILKFVLQTYRVEVKDAPQGIAPPTTTVIKRTPNQPSRLRKYVAKYSAGLRIRSHPSLQSEHIGTVSVNGIISFVDEVNTKFKLKSIKMIK